MLTEKQICELQNLSKHPKYGKILSDAILVWKIVNPIPSDYGINFEKSEKTRKFENYNDSCCLVGAALTGKDFHYDLHFVLGLESKMELGSLLAGFDEGHMNICLKESEWMNKEAYNFAAKIRKIINNS